MPNFTTLHDRTTCARGADARLGGRDTRELDFGYNIVDFASADSAARAVGGQPAGGSGPRMPRSSGKGAELGHCTARLWTVGLGSHLRAAAFGEQPIPFPPQAFAMPTPPSCVMDFQRVQEASSAFLT
jgi:hypothetical protein